MLRVGEFTSANSLFAEIERDLISQQTKEGLANAQAKGKAIGHPKGTTNSKLDGREEEIRLLLSKELAKTSIAKIRGGGARMAVRHFIKTRHLI